MTTSSTDGLDGHMTSAAIKDLIALMGERAWGERGEEPWELAELVIHNATALFRSTPEAVIDAAWIGAYGQSVAVRLVVVVESLDLPAFGYHEELRDLAVGNPASAVVAVTD